MKNHWEGSITKHEVRKNPLRLTYNLDTLETAQYFLPKNTQLHLGNTITHTAVYTKTE